MNQMDQAKIAFFDILYLFMKCDFHVAEEEEYLLQGAMEDLDEEARKTVESRRVDLDNIVDSGLDAIADRVLELGIFVNDIPEKGEDVINEGDDVYEIKMNYITIMMNLIYADGKVHHNEEFIFRKLCKLWKIDVELEEI